MITKILIYWKENVHVSFMSPELFFRYANSCQFKYEIENNDRESKSKQITLSTKHSKQFVGKPLAEYPTQLIINS